MTTNWKIIPSTKEQREIFRTTQRSKYSNVKECIYCHEKFDYGYSSLKYCSCCKILVNCSICGKIFELNLKSYSGTDQVKINNAILNKENLKLFCSKECRIKSQVKTYCNYLDNNIDKFHKSMQNRKYELFCETHGKYVGNNRTSLCSKCVYENSLSENVKLFQQLSRDKNNTIKNNYLYVPIDLNVKSRINTLKECKSCNRKFKPNSPTQTFCGRCYKILICKNCGEKYIVTKGYEEFSQFCSISCSTQNQQKQGKAFNFKNFKNNKIGNNPKKIIPKHTEIVDYLDFKGVPGIWYKYDELNKVVLDVCLTYDIYSEILYHNNQMKNPLKQKFIEMSKIKENIKFYFYSSFDTWEDGLNKEYEFAMKTQAKFWSPAPGIQIKRYFK